MLIVNCPESYLDTAISRMDKPEFQINSVFVELNKNQ